MHSRLRRVVEGREVEKARSLCPRIRLVLVLVEVRLESRIGSSLRRGTNTQYPTSSRNNNAKGGKSCPKKGNDTNAQRDSKPCGKCGRLYGGKFLVGSNACYGCGKIGHMIRDCLHARNQAKEDTQPRPNPSTVVEPPK